jgi:hypothetical protein
MAMQHKLVLVTTFFGAPYILWLVLFLIARYSAFNMRRIVPWVRVLRRVTWSATPVLFLMCFVLARLPSIYFFLSVGFSSGMIAIHRWAIKRFAPERIFGAGWGFWQSKPESWYDSFGETSPLHSKPDNERNRLVSTTTIPYNVA